MMQEDSFSITDQSPKSRLFRYTALHLSSPPRRVQFGDSSYTSSRIGFIASQKCKMIGALLYRCLRVIQGGSGQWPFHRTASSSPTINSFKLQWGRTQSLVSKLQRLSRLSEVVCNEEPILVKARDEEPVLGWALSPKASRCSKK